MAKKGFFARIRKSRCKSEIVKEKFPDSEYFLVDSGDSQYFVTVTDEFLESRKLSRRIMQKKFKIGEILFTDCGVLK